MAPAKVREDPCGGTDPDDAPCLCGGAERSITTPSAGLSAQKQRTDPAEVGVDTLRLSRFPSFAIHQQLPLSMKTTSRLQSHNDAFPERVTLHWLFKHLPIAHWLALSGIIIGAYLTGLSCARVPWIRELAGIDEPVHRSPDSFSTQIAEITKAHTTRMEALYKQAEIQENEATNLAHLDMYRAEYATSALRLREQIINEEKAFSETIAAFRSIKPNGSESPN